MDTLSPNPDAASTPSAPGSQSGTSTPRNQPRRWSRGKSRQRPFPSRPKKMFTTQQSQRAASTSISNVQQQPSLRSEGDKARALRSFEPVFISTTFLASLVHLICQQVARTDPRLQLRFSELYYASAMMTFYQLARCDALLGLIYSQFHELKIHLASILLPAPIVDYIESLGPYRMLSGVNVLPSVATFLPSDWRLGFQPTNYDELTAVETFCWKRTIHPSLLLAELRNGHEFEANPLPDDRLGQVTTVWEICPSLLASYRMCTARLERKFPCRLVSETLAGRATIAVSTSKTSETSRFIYCAEQQSLIDVKKSCILNYHDFQELRHWPKNNRRLLRPYFEAGYQDISSVVTEYVIEQ